MYEENELLGKRAALYIRCSHDEQVKFGDTLEAQEKDLVNFAKQYHLEVVDIYADEGTTARKSLSKRKQFLRMIEDVKADRIDVIIFKCLDRWIRNVQDYYKIQEILDEHNVVWLCTQEKYNTYTANGRLLLNLKLSIAQDESDRTGERIKYVFENKVRKGEYISGALPYGLKLDEHKHVVPDEEKIEIVKDAFNYFERTQTKRGTYIYIRKKYGVNWCDATFRRMLQNTLYKGEYRGNTNFCEPTIPSEQFDRIQAICKKGYVKYAPSGAVYIFSGLLRCKECGHSLSSMCKNEISRRTGEKKFYCYYRCAQNYSRGLCSHNRIISQRKLEKYLMENIVSEIDRYIIDCQAKTKIIKRPVDKTAEIKKKLSRLKDLYINDLISIDEFRADKEKYEKLLAEYQPPKPQKTTTANLSALKAFLSSDFKEVYKTLTDEEKREMWRSVIKEIVIDNDKNIEIIFL